MSNDEKRSELIQAVARIDLEIGMMTHLSTDVYAAPIERIGLPERLASARRDRADMVRGLADLGMPEGYEFVQRWTGRIGGYDGLGNHTIQILYGPGTRTRLQSEVGYPTSELQAREMAWNHALPDAREIELRRSRAEHARSTRST